MSRGSQAASRRITPVKCVSGRLVSIGASVASGALGSGCTQSNTPSLNVRHGSHRPCPATRSALAPATPTPGNARPCHGHTTQFDASMCPSPRCAPICGHRAGVTVIEPVCALTHATNSTPSTTYLRAVCFRAPIPERQDLSAGFCNVRIASRTNHPPDGFANACCSARSIAAGFASFQSGTLLVRESSRSFTAETLLADDHLPLRVRIVRFHCCPLGWPPGTSPPVSTRRPFSLQEPCWTPSPEDDVQPATRDSRPSLHRTGCLLAKRAPQLVHDVGADTPSVDAE
jgi:hypothetical protein